MEGSDRDCSPASCSAHVSLDPQPHRIGRTEMDLDIGLLWIPAGFLLILVSVAALFLTI
jgi:hypothetical protein